MVGNSVELQQRTEAWFKDVNKHLDVNKPPQSLLNQGYRLFFDYIEPYKQLPSFQSKEPSIFHRIWLTPGFKNRLGDFTDLFGSRYGSQHSWGVHVFGYRQVSAPGFTQATIWLTCGEQFTHGEKKIGVYLTEPIYTSRMIGGQMKIEDTSTGWIREGTNGAWEVAPDRSLMSYPGLAVCKLAVAIIEGYIPKIAEAQLTTG